MWLWSTKIWWCSYITWRLENQLLNHIDKYRKLKVSMFLTKEQFDRPTETRRFRSTNGYWKWPDERGNWVPSKQTNARIIIWHQVFSVNDNKDSTPKQESKEEKQRCSSLHDQMKWRKNKCQILIKNLLMTDFWNRL